MSPMRIRVTVEAEPTGMNTQPATAENAKQTGPALDFDMGTTTITIPLKGEDEHKPVKRRGRPRKSLDAANTPISKDTEQNQSFVKPRGTPKPRKNAASTPARTKQPKTSAKKDSNTTNVTEFPDLDTPSARIEITDEPIAKRTRRSSAVGLTTTPDQAPPSAKKPRKRMDFSALTPLHQKDAVVANEAGPLQEMLFTPWAVRKTREKKIRERVPTPRKVRPAQKVTFSSPLLPEDTGRAIGVSKAEEHRMTHQNDAELEHEVGEGEAEAGEEGEKGQSEEVGSDDDDIEEDVELGEDGYGYSDDADNGMTGLEDDTSVLDRSAVESEGFSMVSIDSLRNHRRVVETENNVRQPQSKLRMEHRISEEPEEVEPRLPQRTGKSPDRSEGQNIISSNGKKHDEDIFGAFGAGTRRQLQARLAMGQLLADNGEETSHAEAPQSSGVHSKESFGNLGAHMQQSRPHRLPTPVEDEVDHEKTTRKSTELRQQPFSLFDVQPLKKHTSQHQSHGFLVPITPSTSGHDDASELSQTQLFEQEVQREREEVIRQAVAANASQIVVLEDTTMNDAEEEEEQPCFDETMRSQEESQLQEDSGVGILDAAEDMWLDEADRSMESSLIPRPARRSLKRKAERHDHVGRQVSPEGKLEDLFPLDNRPPRAKLSRTWRRTSGADFLYSDEPASPQHQPTQTKQDLSQVFAPVPEETADVWLDTQMRHNGGGRAARARNAQPAASSGSAVHATGSNALRQSSRRKAAIASAPVHAMLNAQYFSESEEQDEQMMYADQPHSTELRFRAATKGHNESQNESTIHQSIETDTLAETSDARQLQRELLATTPAHKRRARMRLDKEDIGEQRSNQYRERSKPLLRQPGKVYESLFGSPMQTQTAQSSTPQVPIKQTGSSFVNYGTSTITPFNNVNTDDKPSILNRLTSWLFTAPPANSQSSKTTPSQLEPHTNTSINPPPQPPLATKPTQPSTPQTSTLTWNRNHYLLLDHHYTRVLHSTTKPLPSAYMTPWSSIPFPLRRLVGTKLMTTTAIGTGSETKDTHPATISEQWVRIAYCFVAEAKERGVPVLCNGQFVPTQSGKSKAVLGDVDVNVNGLALGAEWQAREGQGYPVRDEMTGRVKRIRQEWWGTEEGAWDVLGRVYSLWVRDEIMGMSVDGGR